MKIAILYTGAVRTMEKTIHYFKQNVLLNNDRHVFAVVQSNDIEHDQKVLNDISSHIKSLTWFDQNDPHWLNIKRNLLSTMDISDQWKYYLGQGSGSMIEYYQMYLSYLQLEQYENEHQFKYDYVIRIRTDCVVTKPFIIKTYNEEDVKTIFNKQHIFNENDLSTMITLFMTSMLDSNRMNLKNMNRTCYPSFYHHYLINNFDYEQFVKYIKEGYYLITFRENVIYYGPRHVFDKIHQLGITYGQLKTYNDGYWFNAECQLKSICLHHNIDIYDSSTTLEVKSLYEYDVQNYYQNDQLKNLDDVLFFLQRS